MAYGFLCQSLNGFPIPSLGVSSSLSLSFWQPSMLLPSGIVWPE